MQQMRNIWIGVIGVAMLAMACNQPSQHDDPYDPAQVKMEATAMLRDYQAAVRKGGLLAEFGFLDSSADFFWVPPGVDSAMDYAAVRKVLLTNADLLDSVSNVWLDLEVVPLSPEIATYHGKMSAFAIVQGDTSRSRLLESGTLIRRQDGWKLLSGQTVVLLQ